MSNFTSFLGGALRAVNDGIARNREYEKEQEKLEGERDFLREQNQFKAGVQKEIARMGADATVEAARLKQKNAQANKYTTFANLPWSKHIKGSDSSSRTLSAFTALAANPEEYKKSWNDANLRPLMKSSLASLVQAYKTESRFKSEAISGVTSRQAPYTHIALNSLLKNNPLLLDHVKQLEQNEDLSVPVANQIASPKIVGGKRVDTVAPKAKLPAIKFAANLYAKNRKHDPNAPKMTTEAAIQGISESIGASWDESKGNYEGTNKFISAADSPFVKHINGEYVTIDTPDGKLEGEAAARYWLRNENHGFINGSTSNNPGVIKIADVIRLARLYGKQNSSVPGTGPQFPTTAVTVKSLLAKKSSRQNQTVEAARNGYEAARNAGRTTQLLKRDIKALGDGSSIVTGMTALAGGIGPVIRGSINVFRNLIDDKSDFFQADSDYKVTLKGIVERSDKAEELLASKKNLNDKDRRYIIAARIEAIEMTLAYQLTAILQGGTGGRTISDTDVTRTLAIFGGRFTSVDQKLAKIGIIEDFIERARLRGELFTSSNLKDNDNAELFNVYSRISNVVNPFSAATSKEAIEKFSTFVEKKYVEKIGSEKLTSATETHSRDHLMAVIEAHAKKPNSEIIADRRAINNFIKNNIKLNQEDGKTLGIVEDENGSPYILNMKAFGAWMGSTNDKQRNNVISKYNTGGNSTGSLAYDLTQGKLVKVQYNINQQGQSVIDFGAMTPDNTGASAVQPNNSSSIISSAAAATFDNSSTAAASANNPPAAAKKLFGRRSRDLRERIRRRSAERGQ